MRSYRSSHTDDPYDPSDATMWFRSHYTGHAYIGANVGIDSAVGWVT